MTWSASRWFMIGAGVLVMFLSSVDFQNRLWVGRDESLRVFSAPAAAPVPAAIDKLTAMGSLQKWLPRKTINVVDTKPREIVLQGSFGASTGQARAALSLVSAVGLPSQRVKAVVGDVVEGWTIVAIEKRKIVIRRGDESREIWMFRRR